MHSVCPRSAKQKCAFSFRALELHGGFQHHGKKKNKKKKLRTWVRSDEKITICLNIWLLLGFILRSDPYCAVKAKEILYCFGTLQGKWVERGNAFLSNAVERKCKACGFLFQKDMLDLEADSCIVPGEAPQWKSPCARCLSVSSKAGRCPCAGNTHVPAGAEAEVHWRVTGTNSVLPLYWWLLKMFEKWWMLCSPLTAHRKAFCCRYIAFCLEKASWVWCCWRGIICLWVMFLPKHSGCQHSC